MDNQTAKLFSDAADLVYLYNTNSRFKGQVDTLINVPGALFRNRPLKLYVFALTNYSKKYKAYYGEYLKSHGKTAELLTRFYKEGDLLKFNQQVLSNQAPGLGLADLKTLQQIEATKPSQQRQEKYDQFLKSKAESSPASYQIVSVPKGNMPVTPIVSVPAQSGQSRQVEQGIAQSSPAPSQPQSSTDQPRSNRGEQPSSFPINSGLLTNNPLASKLRSNIAGRAGPLIQSLGKRIAPNLVSGAIGALSGVALGGLPGSLVGALGGGLLPEAFKKGLASKAAGLASKLGASSLAKLGASTAGKAAAAILGIGTGPVGWAILAAWTFRKYLKWIIIGIVVLLFGIPMLFLQTLKSTSLLPPFKQEVSDGNITGEKQPGKTPPISKDLASCQFYRGDQTSAATFKSPKLLSYFQQAGEKSGIPAQLLAAFARVESPNSVNFSDESVDNSSCAVSETGALGLMQIQPPGTKGYDPEAVSLGASFLGKQTDSLTKTDFCSVQTSIILASGFIIKKMQYLYGGDGEHWDPKWNSDQMAIYKIAEGYYGCLSYPSCKDGPFSYGQDLWNSLQSCSVQIINASRPTADTSKLSNILSWANKIIDNIETGLIGDFNKMVATISNGGYSASKRLGLQETTDENGLYWCTNLVIDAYNLAGVNGLSANHQAVISMMEFWKTADNFVFYPYILENLPSTLSSVKPGFAFFQVSNSNHQHVSLVSDINIDGRGNGYLKTIDSNSKQKGYTFPIEDWQVKNNFYPVAGFGGAR